MIQQIMVFCTTLFNQQNNYHIKVIDCEGISSQTYIIPKNIMEQLDTSPIKLGLTYDGSDITENGTIETMTSLGKHVALAPYYTTVSGCIYRSMTPPMAWAREEAAVIKDYEETQTKLKGFIEQNYKYLHNPDILLDKYLKKD